jgi:ferredoxin
MWRVTVNDACVGSGMCIGIAPRHFRLDADDRSHPVNAETEPDDSVLDAATSCPMEAISITDLETHAEVVDLWTTVAAPQDASAAPRGERR